MKINIIVLINSVFFCTSWLVGMQEHGDTIDPVKQKKMVVKLFSAVAKNDVFQVKNCITQENIDPNVHNNFGATALHIAAKNGHAEMIQCLFRLGVPYTKDNSGEYPMDTAAKEGYFDIVKAFIEHNVLLTHTTWGDPLVQEKVKNSKDLCLFLGEDIIPTDAEQLALYEAIKIRRFEAKNNDKKLKKIIPAYTDLLFEYQ